MQLPAAKSRSTLSPSDELAGILDYTWHCEEVKVEMESG
jgi:hypothetical protein